MKIKKANLKDAEKIANFNVLLAKESENLNISFNTTLKAVKELIINKNKGFYLLATKDEKIIGQLMITFEWSDWSNKDFWWIQSVYVDKDFRKKGVFKNLLTEVKKQAKKNNVSQIRLYVFKENKKAIKAYKSLNMKEKEYIIFETEV